MKYFQWFVLAGILQIAYFQTYAAESHKDSEAKQGTTSVAERAKHEDGKLIEISSLGQRAAKIVIEVLQPRSHPLTISAPGEVIPNAEKTAIISPRIQAQVVKRLVRIGQHVKKGDALVQLSSVAMANAQGNLLLASKEWHRVKKLGKQAVSAKRYQSVRILYHQAYGKLLAYGMTRSQIDAFLSSDNPNRANGEFTLLALRSGTIFNANFTEGQMIEVGHEIYKIVNEAVLWVDARLSNDEVLSIKSGASVIIKTNHYRLPGRVLQVHHRLEATTRTQVVRIEVPNRKHRIHPGQFVTCIIKVGNSKPVLTVPKAALLRTSDGDYVVYQEKKPNHFKAIEVKRIKVIGDKVVVKGELSGLRIVTKGAFFVHSEGLKKGFSTHNH